MEKQQQENNKAVETMKETVQKVSDTIEERLTTVEVERKEHLKEMQSLVDRLQQRLRDAENRPTSHSSKDTRKEVKFDGSSPYPMEFLCELVEIKENSTRVIRSDVLDST